MCGRVCEREVLFCSVLEFGPVPTSPTRGVRGHILEMLTVLSRRPPGARCDGLTSDERVSERVSETPSGSAKPCQDRSRKSKLMKTPSNVKNAVCAAVTRHCLFDSDTAVCACGRFFLSGLRARENSKIRARAPGPMKPPSASRQARPTKRPYFQQPTVHSRPHGRPPHSKYPCTLRLPRESPNPCVCRQDSRNLDYRDCCRRRNRRRHRNRCHRHP